MKKIYRNSALALVALFCFAFNTNSNAQVIRTVAGDGVSGYQSDGVPATTTSFQAPFGVAVDKAGNLFIADQYNQRIREVVRSTGDMISLVGNGSSGFGGDGNTSSAVTLNYPTGIALDTAGNIYITDVNNYRVREIDKTTGNINTVAGNGASAYGSSGIPASSAGMSPQGIALDDSGNIYLTDATAQMVYKIYASTGNFVSIAGDDTAGFAGDNGPATAAKLNGPVGLSLDKKGNIYIADQNNNRIRMINQNTGIITTIAGTGSTNVDYTVSSSKADTSAIYAPYAVAVDTITGNIYITDPNNVVRVINVTTGIIKPFAGIAGNGSFGGDGMDATIANLDSPMGLTIDDSDNVYMTDQGNERIREIFTNGPAITSEPVPSYACNGSSASFGITATGVGVTYQWLVDSNYSGKWDTLKNAGVYSGATTDSLKISVVNAMNTTEYMCSINNGYEVTPAVYLNINSYPPIAQFNGLVDSICPGAQTTITASLYSGGGGYVINPHDHGNTKKAGPPSTSYLWNTGDTTAVLTVSPLVTTTYSLALYQSGCTTDTTVTVYVDRDKVQGTAFPSSSVCAGNNVTVFGSGGTGSYSWSGGTGNVSNGVSFSPAATATYTVTGVDAMGCILQNTFPLTVNTPPFIIITSNLKDTMCAGDVLSLTASGASTYSWSNGITNGVGFTPSASAVYYVTGTDANGCSASASLTEVVNPLPIVTGTASPDAVCQGASLSLSGNGAASYTWSGGVTNGIAFVPASSGSYSVTGKDKNGCLGSAAVNITVNPLPIISASAFPSAILCQGSSLALFGAGGASYSWSNGVNNGVSFTPPASTTYTVTGIDANGCTASANIAVTVHHKVVPTLTSNNTTCGLKNGSASASGSNGIAPYTYSWSTVPASSTSFIDSLAPGTYVVTVSDSANCASSSAVSIGSSTAPILSVSTTNSNCGFLGTGSASVAVTGGNAPYHYMWNNGDTLASNYNLRAATYIITVTDVNGCSSFAPAIVSNLNGPKIATQSIVNVKCNGSPTGAITVAVSGGNPPYHYNWSNGSSSSAISALFAGPYQLVVFDADSCTSVESFVITQPNALSVSSASVKADCGVSNGSASVAVTGGLAPYSYSWNNGVSANVNAAVPAGVYYVTIIDANGCADSSLIAVSNKTGPSLALSLSANASCGSGGLISVVATGGSLPYAYHWSNGVTASSVSNVPAGNYYVTVTDGKGCVGSADTSVSEVVPAALSLCMVTVDPLVGKHNYIIWDKSLAKKISHYNIYKESTSAGVYFKIDSVPFDSAGIYVDLLSDATVRSWRYKISQVDSCGNESSLSPAHKTMHLTVNQGVGHNINLIWDNYEGLNFSTYYVYRDTIASKYTLIDSIPNNIFTYTDNKFPYSTKPFLYRIGISNPGGCAPAIEAINYNASKSNTGNFTFNPTAGIAAIDAANAGLSVFPNPNNGVFTFALNTDKGSKELNLSVVNTLGQVVISHVYEDVPAAFTKTLDLSSLAKGVYFLKLQSDNATLYNKVVIQ